MKFYSNKPIESLVTYLNPKSKKLKLFTVLIALLCLLAAFPDFSSPGLTSAKTISPYSNGTFPQALETNLDATYRIAFPNLTFFYSIAFKQVLGQSKFVLGQLNGIINWFEDDEATTDKNLLLDLSAEVGLVSDCGTVSFTPNMRVPGDTDDFILGRSSVASAHYGHIELMASSNSGNFTTDFYFNDNATQGLDPGYDAAIYGGILPEFSIYSNLVEDITGGIPFSIQALSSNAVNNVVIPIGINANQGQQVSFSISESDLSSDIDIYIEDTENNTFTRLNENSYSITADSDLSGVGRFYLRFEGNALSTIESSINELNIYSDKSTKSVIIKGQLYSDTDVVIYDLSGKKLLNNKLDVAKSTQSISVEHLSAGIYILELTSKLNSKRIEKIIIR